MNTKGFLPKHAGRLCCLLLFTLLADVRPAQAQFYQVGQVVTNFAIYTRRAWTNLAGKAFAPGAPIRLSDFSGQIVFLEFFDPT